MSDIDAVAIASELQVLYGMEFRGTFQLYQGGNFPAVRPVEPVHPNGCAVLLSRSPRQVEAVFVTDSFSRALVNTLSQSDGEARISFASLARDAISEGCQINVTINGNDVSPQSLPGIEWESFGLECSWRLPLQRISEQDLHKYTTAVASRCIGLVISLLDLNEIVENTPLFEEGLPEGAVLKVEVNKYERNPVNRAACLAHFGTTCNVCGFDFGQKYGEIGKSYIEVHHKIPVSAMGGSYSIVPTRDLVPVCSNCHAMLHRRNPPLTVEELRIILGKK